jgi:hypothetical protein
MLPTAKIFEFADGGIFEHENAGRQEARKSLAGSAAPLPEILTRMQMQAKPPKTIQVFSECPKPLV